MKSSACWRSQPFEKRILAHNWRKTGPIAARTPKAFSDRSIVSEPTRLLPIDEAQPWRPRAGSDHHGQTKVLQIRPRQNGGEPRRGTKPFPAASSTEERPCCALRYR